jgi:hypothetical protein
VLHPPSASEIAGNLGTGLLGTYAASGDRWTFERERPGPGWHRLDWRPRTLFVLVFYPPKAKEPPPVRLEERVLFRRRWRFGRSGRTHQDRSPDEVGRRHVVLLVLLLKLWGWLSSEKGLLRHEEVIPSLTKHGCERTLSRWLARALPCALDFERAVVFGTVERSEPRPVEQLFPRGLSPPDTLLRRRWRDPARTSTLWQGLAWLLGGAIELGLSTTALLAEVRRRTPDLTFTS